MLSSKPTEEAASAPAPRAAPEDSGDRKARRQAAANQRAQLQPLKKSLRQLEQRIEKGQQSLQALQRKLADDDLYHENAGSELAELLKQEGRLKSEVAELENAWLEQQAALEAVEASGA